MTNYISDEDLGAEGWPTIGELERRMYLQNNWKGESGGLVEVRAEPTRYGFTVHLTPLSAYRAELALSFGTDADGLEALGNYFAESAREYRRRVANTEAEKIRKKIAKLQKELDALYEKDNEGQ